MSRDPRSPAPAAQPSLLLRIPEAATMLGFSPRWLWQQITAGDAPVVRTGKNKRSVRLRRADVEAFAADGAWPTKAKVA